MPNEFALGILVVGASIFAGLIGVLLAMGRQVREDHRLDRNYVTRSYPGLSRNYAIIAVIVVVLGVIKGELILALGFGGFAAALSAIFRVNRPR